MYHSIELFHQPTLMHNFLYSLTICLLHYYHRNVSSINMPIFRRKNCIHTTSGISALYKRLHSTLVESGLCEYNFSSWRWACWCSKHVEDNSVTDILLMNKENCALKLVDVIILKIFTFTPSIRLQVIVLSHKQAYCNVTSFTPKSISS